MKRFAIVAASMLVASTAVAGQYSFEYSSEDLASPEAVASLHQRIDAEANKYCQREFSKTKDLRMKDACVENFVKSVTSGIDGGGRYASVTDNQQIGS